MIDKTSEKVEDADGFDHIEDLILHFEGRFVDLNHDLGGL